MAVRTAPAADAAGERAQRSPAAGGHQHAHDHAERLRPVGEGQQHHAMHDQCEVHRRHHAVGLHETAVGEALDQRDRGEHGEEVEGPLADGFGEAALLLEEAEELDGLLGARAARGFLQPAPADRPLGALGPQPVHHADRQAGDAQPLVQPVGLVHAAEQRLERGGAQGEDHRDAHRAHGEHAGVVDRERAQREVGVALDQQWIGPPPQQAEGGEDEEECEFDVLHDGSLRAECGRHEAADPMREIVRHSMCPPCTGL